MEDPKSKMFASPNLEELAKRGYRPMGDPSIIKADEKPLGYGRMITELEKQNLIKFSKDIAVAHWPWRTQDDKSYFIIMALKKYL